MLQVLPKAQAVKQTAVLQEEVRERECCLDCCNFCNMNHLMLQVLPRQAERGRAGYRVVLLRKEVREREFRLSAESDANLRIQVKKHSV
jgi:hypothetical protein